MVVRLSPWHFSCSLSRCLPSFLVLILAFILSFSHYPHLLAAVLSLYFSPFIPSICLSLSPHMLSLPPALSASSSLLACFSLLSPSICLFSACFSGLHSTVPPQSNSNTTNSPHPLLIPPLCVHFIPTLFFFTSSSQSFPRFYLSSLHYYLGSSPPYPYFFSKHKKKIPLPTCCFFCVCVTKQRPK